LCNLRARESNSQAHFHKRCTGRNSALQADSQLAAFRALAVQSVQQRLTQSFHSTQAV
jgi:hypothetical protein